MCGIAGYMGSREIPESRINACLALMKRRGPDSAAHRRFLGPSESVVHLLHSRLSIIDLDRRADQPFRIKDKWIVLNGEVYNYRELRAQLKKMGVEFRTTSDTEVLLAAIHHLGWDILDQCEGMWAFGVYDRTDGCLTLCRDRFGEKPLYLFQEDGGFYFGSETKFVTALLGRSLSPDYDHLKRYLVNGYKALYKTDQTFFNGLGELERASWLRIEPDGKTEKGRYWQPSFEQEEGMGLEEAVSGVRERLIRSMELRLRADVPLAFCMSGGIDSNSLICTAKRVFDYDVHGFTIVNEDERYEEAAQVEQVVAELGLKHTLVPISGDNFQENIRELVLQHDAPVYTISYYVHWLLMSRIKAAGYRISISGTAADEILSGYYDHHNLYLGEMAGTDRHPTALKEWQERQQPLVRNPYLKNPDLFVTDPFFRGHIYLNNDQFAGYLVQPWMEDFAEASYTSANMRNRMLNELFHEAVPVILHEDDLNAMYFSIENRSPFLDRDLFEFTARIPTRHLVQEGLAKYVLRRAMSGLVPDQVLWNPRKVGFNAPVQDFINTADPAMREWLLSDGPIFRLVRRPMIEELLGKDKLPNSESKFLFYFVCAKVFLENLG